jgi:hypothetical protein
MVVSKRPSVIGGLKLQGSDASALAADGAPEHSDAATNAKPARRVRPEVVHTSVYLPREVHRRLREIAFTRDCKVHDVIMEGIDAALQKHGHPSIEALRTNQKSGE